MTRIRKSPMMKRAEEQIGRPLEEFLPDMLTEYGLVGTAAELRVNKSTLWYWTLRFNIQIHRVVLRPGETFEIKRAPDG